MHVSSEPKKFEERSDEERIDAERSDNFAMICRFALRMLRIRSQLINLLLFRRSGWSDVRSTSIPRGRTTFALRTVSRKGVESLHDEIESSSIANLRADGLLQFGLIGGVVYEGSSGRDRFRKNENE